jgi:hypothetical protein
MKKLLKKFLQKLTRKNLSNTYQLGWKAFKWVMQVTEGYHWLITFSIFSGIFGWQNHQSREYTFASHS